MNKMSDPYSFNTIGRASVKALCKRKWFKEFQEFSADQALLGKAPIVTCKLC